MESASNNCPYKSLTRHRVAFTCGHFFGVNLPARSLPNADAALAAKIDQREFRIVGKFSDVISQMQPSEILSLLTKHINPPDLTTYALWDTSNVPKIMSGTFVF